MARIESTSAGAFSKSLHGTNIAGVYDVFTKDLYRYQLLYDSVISQMNVYINYFSTGEYDTLTEKFTLKQYNNLILRADAASFNTANIENLTGFEHNPDKFNLMRQSAYNVIDGLEKTITIVKEKKALESDIVILTRDYKDVLEDPVKLMKYINDNKLDKIPFEASQTFSAVIELKPWYKVYFQKYGAPPKGAFKSDLLAQIVIDLIASGTITEEEFINS